MKFLIKEHENQFLNLLQRDGTHLKDVERLTLFYIILGNADLYAKAKSVYDFAKHQIEPDCLHDGNVDFCNSFRALIRLGCNLYNRYQEDKSSPIQILSGLDTDYFLLATEIMRIRIGYPQQIQSTLNDEELGL